MLRRSNSWREGTESPGAGFSTFGVVSPVQYFSYGYAQASPEQPIFTTKAHVFEIDPETKKNWVPSSKQAVAVSFYYDGTRNSYRIISVEGSKAIVNSTVTPSMTFTKTSQKFGQWSDARANTVYGLGFLSEGELSKFIEKFKEVKELTRAALQQKALEVNGSAEDQAINPPHPKALHQRTNSLSSIQVENSNSRGERRNSFTQGQGGQQANSAKAQLKYENDRLKLALAQSSTNAKKWEVELQTLKNNNARLTEALQESTANVEEWQKQLANYRQETARLKARLQSMELEQHTGRGGGDEAQLKSEINALTDQVETLRLTNSQKEEELESFRKQMAEVPGRSNQVTALQSRIQSLEEENHGLNKRLQELQSLVANLRAGRQDDHSDLLRLQDQLGSKITELYEIHEQLVATIKKESTS